MVNYKRRLVLLLLLFVPVVMRGQSGGELRWLRVGTLHQFYSEQGAEAEFCRTGDDNDGLFWPAAYGLTQASMTAKAMWIGCKNFFDPVMKKDFTYKVVGVGPRASTDLSSQMFTEKLQLIRKYDHPMVFVDGVPATDNEFYDVYDSLDEALVCDRMVLNKNHTSMGVTMTRRVMAWGQSAHSNYHISEYKFKNTGIIDGSGTEAPQDLDSVYFYFSYRYSFSGESVPGFDEGWGMWNATWGRNAVNHVVGQDPNATYSYFFSDKQVPQGIRAQYCWYGPHSERAVDDDWGCPDELGDGILAAARFVGVVTLHADKSVADTTDDVSQPVSTWYLGSDADIANSLNQYSEEIMARKYEQITRGDPELTHAEEVGSQFANEWGEDAGGYKNTQAFGPYNLAVGDSVRIVLAEGVAGISREKNREVGSNWLQWENSEGSPDLVLPDGNSTTDHNYYKEMWVKSCEDSLYKTFFQALANYESGYQIPSAPPAPETFSVNSGGDRISMSWSNNAETHDYFAGYVIYRAQNVVFDEDAVYTKIFECSGNNSITSFDDTTAQRGLDYYYYIQSKDDGSQCGEVLSSSKFMTMTNRAANLLRPAETALEEIRVVPNPFYIDSREYQFGKESLYDRLVFYGLPPQCKISIFTERGDLVWEKEHTNGSGDEYWDSITSSGQIVVSGLYIAYFKVTEDVYEERVTGDGSTEQVKVLSKGNNTYRKFIIIR